MTATRFLTLIVAALLLARAAPAAACWIPSDRVYPTEAWDFAAIDHDAITRLGNAWGKERFERVWQRLFTLQPLQVRAGRGRWTKPACTSCGLERFVGARVRVLGELIVPAAGQPARRSYLYGRQTTCGDGVIVELDGVLRAPHDPALVEGTVRAGRSGFLGSAREDATGYRPLAVRLTDVRLVAQGTGVKPYGDAW